LQPEIEEAEDLIARCERGIVRKVWERDRDDLDVRTLNEWLYDGDPDQLPRTEALIRSVVSPVPGSAARAPRQRRDLAARRTHGARACVVGARVRGYNLLSGKRGEGVCGQPLPGKASTTVALKRSVGSAWSFWKTVRTVSPKNIEDEAAQTFKLALVGESAASRLQVRELLLTPDATAVERTAAEDCLGRTFGAAG
jgi:hypothetical protein